MNLKNRIGPSTLLPEKSLDFMEQVIHRRAAPFYRMYVQMINFATFTIVAHRNLISLYNMGSSDRWEDTIQISKDYVRNCQIKKRLRSGRKLEKVGTIAVLTEGASKTKT